MLALTKTYAAKNDLKTRQHLMERSYARSTRFGFDRARWRGLWKVGIQEYLVSAIAQYCRQAQRFSSASAG